MFCKPGHNASMAMKHKKTMEDYYLYVGSTKQASNFKTTAEFLLNYIQRTFEEGFNIAEALQTLRELNTTQWALTLQVSNADNKTTREIEKQQFDVLYKAEVDKAVLQKKLYCTNKSKAYTLFWERCAKAMQNQIMGCSNYKLLIMHNPIELLKAIKVHALNYQESRYEMLVLLNLMQALLTTKQQNGESHQDYT